MIKCEKCLYRKNCQFLATHKNTTVEGCTAFESESALKAEVVKEFAERFEAILATYECTFIETQNWSARNTILQVIQELRNLVKEMVGED
jgi:hypothetical protein